MANGTNKQDEYNLSVLREQLSLSANKYCFDCHQRGPTYVNVTIGSFVCTSCSGLLRGLTPPHRVKSITMATFSTEEIDLIKSRGNENCQRIWLGMYDSNQPTKDEKQIKDFMVAKYEKKLYYSDIELPKLPNGTQSEPPAVTTNTANCQISSNNITSAVNIPSANKFEYFKEEPPIQNQFSVQSSQSFANFDDNPAFSSCFGSSNNLGVAVESTSPSWKSNGFQAPTEDRYAALKDLDCLMKSQVQLDTPLQLDNSNSSTWSSDTSINGPWSNQVSENSTQNPFKSCVQDSWTSTNNVANPFEDDPMDDWQNSIQWPNGITSSQSMGFNDVKPWSADFSNPFKVGSTSPINKHSSNPFL